METMDLIKDRTDISEELKEGIQQDIKTVEDFMDENGFDEFFLAFTCQGGRSILSNLPLEDMVDICYYLYTHMDGFKDMFLKKAVQEMFDSLKKPSGEIQSKEEFEARMDMESICKSVKF